MMVSSGLPGCSKFAHRLWADQGMVSLVNNERVTEC